MDQGNDDPSLARTQLNALLLKVQAILAEVTAGNTIPEKELANTFTALQSLDAGFDIHPAGSNLNLIAYAVTNNDFQIRFNDDGAGNQIIASQPSYAIQFHAAELAMWVRPAGGAYTQIFKGIPTSKTLDLQATGLFYDGVPIKEPTLRGRREDAGIYEGHVSASGVISDGPSGWAASGPVSGVYTVTHNLGSAAYRMHLSAFTSSATGKSVFVSPQTFTTISFTYKVYDDAGNPVTVNFSGVDFLLTLD